MAARAVQQARLEGSGVACNARMQPGQLRRYCALGDEGAKLLKTAFDRLALTARSYDRILKVARTIADLDGSAEHRPEAYRRGHPVPVVPAGQAIIWKRGTQSHE